MDVQTAKDILTDRAFELDDEQFEELSKILVEEVENPLNIELTPFRGDGGIDIRGSYGQSFLDAKFGVQVKQHRSNVGTPAMREFVGALTQHGYQFGCFISASGYANDAIDLAREQPIILIDRECLTDIMLSHELGVTYDGFDYELDPTFWEIFDKTQEDELVETAEVPQADSLSVLHICLEAIEQGRRFKPEITEYMIDNTDREDWAPRQADYYPLAGWALGYIHKDTTGEYEGVERRQWGLTRDGTEYLELVGASKVDNAHKNLQQHIRESTVMRRILPIIEDKGEIKREELIEILRERTKLTRSTPDRRATTVGNWLAELEEVRKASDGQSIKFEWIESRLDDYVEDDS